VDSRDPKLKEVEDKKISAEKFDTTKEAIGNW
jgi:hypothetical protein